jgi:hypothetical protein
MAIPNQTITMHHVGDVIEDIAMSMRAEDFPHIAGLLTDLYSNPIAAVIREYSTNAWDSHVSAGLDRPIEVSLPTEDRLEFVVQDFGLGLNVNDLREVYSMYGCSSKRGSNDVAGMLGLGCKSGLTYAEMFTVTAVKDGVKTVAVSTKDEHGIGVIKVLDTLGTDEPNGVRIAIPVDRFDLNQFRNEAVKFYQFWEDGTVLVDGEAPAAPSWLATSLRLDGDTWLVRHDAGLLSSYVTMGNVAYPVEDARVGRVSYRFVARLNIGDVDIAPSREDVRHTRHTDATLAELTEHIGANYKRAIDRALSTTKSRWEETLLKALWMDRNIGVRASSDRPIWTFNPHISWGRKAQGHTSYPISRFAQNIDSTWVITGFSAKNLSTAARDRLVEYVGSKASFVIVPDGATGIGQLEGRPNTVAWVHVVGNTTKPKADRAARGPKVETRYEVMGGSALTADELAALSGKVVYLESGEHSSNGTLGATVIRLYSINQLPRLKRYIPGLVHYQDELQRQRKAALAALTAEDGRIAQARTLPALLKSLDHTKVDDPELAEHIRLSKADDTPTMEQARLLGVGVDHKPLPDYFKKYPLLGGDGGGGYYGHSISHKMIQAERLFYVNARYAANVAAQAQAVAS